MTDDKLITRIVRPEDGPALIELSRKTPMLGKIEVHIERSPDYFRFYYLHGMWVEEVAEEDRFQQVHDVWSAMVAEKEGRVVGIVANTHRHMLFRGKKIIMGYPLDARIDPDFQHQGIAKKIGFKFMSLYPFVKMDCIVGFIIKGNTRAVTGFTGGVKEILAANHGGDFHMLQLSMYRPYRVSRRYPVERAVEADKTEILELLREQYKGYNFSPIFDEGTFDRMLDSSPGYDMSCFRVVREGGRIVACAGFWDQREVRTVVVRKNAFVIKLGIWLAKLIRLFLKSPPPPEEGKPMYSLYIRHLAFRPGYEAAVKNIIKQVHTETRRGSDINFIWGAYHDADPNLNLFRWMTKTTVISGLYFTRWNTDWDAPAEGIKSEPAYADFSMV